MAHEEEHLTPDEIADKAWALAEKMRIALFVTHDGERHRIRPLSANLDRDAHEIAFLVSVEGGKTPSRAGRPVPTLVEQIEAYPLVSLAFADPGSTDYVSITGRAEVSNDRVRIRKLWTPFAKAWWDSADDPDIRLVTVTPEDAEIWVGPNKLIAYATMLTAAATGAKPAVGDHGAARI
jgi:general stress protein 26